MSNKAPSPPAMASSDSKAGSKGDNSYKLTGAGTNSKGNHWDSRDYSESQPGAANKNTYHYSNKDGSYYYSNPNGSTYYNNGKGGSRYEKK